jgi:hypothetical protein
VVQDKTRFHGHELKQGNENTDEKISSRFNLWTGKNKKYINC